MALAPLAWALGGAFEMGCSSESSSRKREGVLTGREEVPRGSKRRSDSFTESGLPLALRGVELVFPLGAGGGVSMDFLLLALEAWARVPVMFVIGDRDTNCVTCFSLFEIVMY